MNGRPTHTIQQLEQLIADNGPPVAQSPQNPRTEKSQDYQDKHAELLADRRTEDRSIAILRHSGVKQLLKLTDAMEVCTRIADQKLSTVRESTVDEKFKTIFEVALRLSLEQELINLRVAAIGPEFDPNQFLPEEM